MTMHFLRLFIAIITLIGLAGCSSFAPLPDTTRYYTLLPAVHGPGAPPAGATDRLGVRVSVQPEYLRRPPMAVRSGENEMRFAQDHRWAEAVDDAIERALAHALQARLATHAVVPARHGVASGAAMINLSITACEGNVDGTALLEAYWRISADPPIATEEAGYFRRTRDGWNGEDYGQLAGMLGDLVDELAAELTTVLGR